ncbi:MAG: polysaccharide biosynthesis protein [Acidimicrobiia bacterium]|nr:polysaccharide biosynthesis protein [Acidimicrobiia bacterium]
MSPDASGQPMEVPQVDIPHATRVRLAQYLARARADLAFAVIDAIVVGLAYTAALVLRFMDIQGITPDWWQGFAITLPLIVMAHLGANLLFGAYGHVWEYASVDEAMRLVFAATAAGLALVAMILGVDAAGLSNGRLVPIMVLILGAGLSLAGMGALRFRSRMFSFHRAGQSDPAAALVIGTGRAAADLARNARTNGGKLRVVAFVSTNDETPIRRLAGLPVLGTLDDVPALVDMLNVHQVVIADAIGENRTRELVDACAGIDVGLRVVPQVDDVLGTAGSLRDVRDLELTDLLPRAAVDTDLTAVADLLRGKRVLVTGAGGSIGSEIVRQVCRFGPAEVYAFDNDETHLYEAMLGLAGSELAPHQVLSDIRDMDSLKRTFSELRPDVVFHAAAHKHVPILEAFPDEAIKTNVIGTANVIRASLDVGVERFVLISTDKAVDPSSIMGASKRIAEMQVQTAAANSPTTVFAAVRFGNVLGSRGSVVPTFMRQIKGGGPVTVSDPSMLRYFMTIDEAVHLVLQASAIANGGEVFVLDMGAPVRIGDLARRMIRLAGLVPGRDIEVQIVGARPGEKHSEVLSREPLRPSCHPKIRLAAPKCPKNATLLDAVSAMHQVAASGDRATAREMLHGLAWQTDNTELVIHLDQMAPATAPDPPE